MRYAWAAWGLLRAWRRHLAELDEALRDAVQRRDEHLAALGLAAAQVDEPALAAFRQTLAAVEAEGLEAVTRVEQAAASLAAAEVETRETLAQHDRAVEGCREALAPLERRLRELRTQQEALEQAAAGRASQRRNLETRLVRLQEKLGEATLESEARPPLQDEHTATEARLAELAETAARDDAALAELAEPVASLRMEVTQAADALEAAREARRTARLAAEAHLAELGAALRGAQNQQEALARRRQAVLVDLGHASLERPDLAVAGRQEATTALEHIEQLRAARAGLERDRTELDRAPMHLTFAVLGGGFLLLLLIWAAW